MILINPDAIEGFIIKHPDAASSLDLWQETVESASWRHLIDVRKNFPHADGVKVSHKKHETILTVFNIRGNRYRLVSEIDYEAQIVDIRAIMTHAEYDRNKWKSI